MLWQGQKDKNGYGTISIFGKKYPSHLLSVMIKDNLREVPKDNLGRRLVARHFCTNKLCCEPSHIFLGIYDLNNLDDKLRDGTLLRGETQPVSKYSEELVRAIKESWKPLTDPSHVSVAQRAERFGVPKSLVVSIDYGHSWAHVPGNNDDEVQEKVKQRKQREQRVRAEVRQNGIPPEDYELLKDKIYKKSEVQPPKEDDVNGVPCRIWKGPVHDGYGRVSYRYVRYFAHVIVCENKEKIRKPEGLITRHLCNNKLCVEENHLAFGLYRRNALDYLETNPSNVKLNFVSAAEIRQELEKDSSKENKKRLAEKYGVAEKTIAALKHNNAWKLDI